MIPLIKINHSVRILEQMVRTFAETDTNKHPKLQKKIIKLKTTLPFYSNNLIHTLGRNLDKEIEVKRNNKGKGKIVISFTSDEDFKNLMEKLNKS